MRIALVAPPWFSVPPDGYGGIESVVALLADGLAERGHEVTLFAPPGSRTRARLVAPLGEEQSPPAGAVGDPWYEAAHAVAAYERAEEFDLLHDHTGPVGASIGAVSGATVVHTLHGPFTGPAKLLYGRLARKLWFVAISESQRSFAPPGLRWAGVVYNGIAMDRYPFAAGRDRGDYLVFIGRVDEEKAPDLAVEAARRAGRKLLMCCKIQNEREERYWAEKVEPLLGRDGADVEVLGECDHDDKTRLLGGAAAVLFPVQWPEPFGLVMVEAMACGTPVVAWRNGSVPEVVEDGRSGFMVDSMDEFVAAIGKVDQLDRAAARDHVARRFSAEAMVDGYEEAYRRALAGHEG
ncbi:MAG TPA: glycosyltransferase family 4 protein [Actinomycetota bacterium]